MKTTEPDDIGYCFYVQASKVFTLRIRRSDFEDAHYKLMWIKKLLGGEIEKLEIEQSVYLEGVYKQFSDLAIDIFVDTDGIGKGLPLLAVTSQGLELFGNVVILARDDEGETILLNKQQLEIITAELGFYHKYEKIEVSDVNTGSLKHSLIEEVPRTIKTLAGLLVEHCVDEGLQLLGKAKDSSSNNGDMALVMCLHGDPELIDSCQKMLRDFIDSNLESSDNI